MQETESTAPESQGRRSGRGAPILYALLALCMIVATVSVAVIALQEVRQTKCAQASANADAWVAVNVVARDFSKEVSLAQNRAAVTAIDKRLHSCLPAGR